MFFGRFWGEENGYFDNVVFFFVEVFFLFRFFLFCYRIINVVGYFFIKFIFLLNCDLKYDKV